MTSFQVALIKSFLIKLGDTLRAYSITQLPTEGRCWLEFFKLRTKLLCFFSDLKKTWRQGKIWKRWINSLLNVKKRYVLFTCFFPSLNHFSNSLNLCEKQLQWNDSRSWRRRICHGEYELPMTFSSFVCDTNYRLSSFKNHQPLSSPQKSYDEYFPGQFCGSDLSCVTQVMGLLQ